MKLVKVKNLKKYKTNENAMKNLNKKESFAQSVMALMTAQVIVKILGLFYKLYITNRKGFGDEGNAIANSAFQIYSLILSLTSLGIPSALSKIIAEKLSIGDHRNANKIFRITLFIFSIIGLIGSYALFAFSKQIAENYLKIKEARLSIIALAPSIFLVAIISVFKGYFIGREEIKKTAKAQGVDQLVKTFFTFIVIELNVFFTKENNTMVMASISNLATTFGNIAELIYLVVSYKKEYNEISLEIQNSVNYSYLSLRKIIKEVLSVAIPISLTGLIITISKNIDSISIVHILSKVIGYEKAKKQYGILSGKVDALINLPLSFNMAIITALLPSIASSKNNVLVMKKRIKKSFIFGFLLTLPVTIIYFIFPNKILKILFFNAYDGYDLLRISSISIIFIMVEQISNTILQAIGKTKIPIISILIGVIIKALLNFILVNKTGFILGGARGAAFSSVCCHFIAGFISFYFVYKNIYK